MTSKDSLILYTRSGCHLCEIAADLLRQAGMAWRAVDIDGDPELLGRYGLTVPVIHDLASGHELAFPFGLEELERFAAQ